MARARLAIWDPHSSIALPLDQATDAVTCVAAGKGGDAQIMTSSVDGKVGHSSLLSCVCSAGTVAECTHSSLPMRQSKFMIDQNL